MKKTTGYVEFFVKGVFDISKYSHIDVFIKDSHRIGEPFYHINDYGKKKYIKNRSFKDDMVSFSTPERSVDKDIEDDLTQLIERLLPYRDLILDTLANYKAKANFAIVLYVYDEANPETYIEQKTIQLISSFRASLWHDIYALGEDEDNQE